MGPPTIAIDTEITADPRQPRLEAGATIECGQCAEQFEEDLLCQILGLVDRATNLYAMLKTRFQWSLRAYPGPSHLPRDSAESDRLPKCPQPQGLGPVVRGECISP